MTIEEFKNKLEQDKALKAAMKEAIEAGKEQEFLAAQGVEVPERKELSDEELEGAAGGLENEGYFISRSVYKTDSRGNPTHWLNTYSEMQIIVYYTCPNCGRVLHEGWGNLMFCDPCDDWFSDDGWFGGAVYHEEPYNG